MNNKLYIYLNEQFMETNITSDDVIEKDKEINRLKDLCNKYEEEHNTAFKLWTQKMEEMPDYEERMKLKKEVDRLNNIIDELEKELHEKDEVYSSKTGIENQMVASVFGYILNKLKQLKEGNK